MYYRLELYSNPVMRNNRANFQWIEQIQDSNPFLQILQACYVSQM